MLRASLAFRWRQVAVRVDLLFKAVIESLAAGRRSERAVFTLCPGFVSADFGK
jgi:hypothetical protein